MTPATALYQTDPFFKDTVDKLVQSGLDLGVAETEVVQLEASLIKARSSLDVRRSLFDKTHGLCATHVETHSEKPEDVHGLGFAVLVKTAQPFAPPVNIEAKYDGAKDILRVHVIYTSGQHQCAIEVSPDPVAPDSYKRLDGTGVTRSLSGYAPGTDWVGPLRCAWIRWAHRRSGATRSGLRIQKPCARRSAAAASTPLAPTSAAPAASPRSPSTPPRRRTPWPSSIAWCSCRFTRTSTRATWTTSRAA